MDSHFEQQKNAKATGYTLGIAGLILFLLLIISWKTPKIEEPKIDEGVEVNLGNSEVGGGDIAPQTPGEPAPDAAEQKQASPPAQQVANEKQDEPDPNDKEPAVTKTVEKPKPAVKQNDNPPVQKPVVTKAPPAIVQPKPKADFGKYKGGNGPGGNNADDFNNVKNQGDDKGKGDKGKQNGNPNSDNYNGTGGTGTGGVTVVRGNRTVVRATRLEGEFTSSATLYIDVRVDESGTGTFLKVTKGINQSQYTSIIKQRLASRDIQFSSGGDETVVNIRIDFKVN